MQHAGASARFWRYWNPIWSYSPSRYVHRQVGAQAAEPEPVFVITQWLTLIGLLIVGGAIEFDYGRRASLDAALAVAPLLLVLWLRGSLNGWIGRKAGIRGISPGRR